MDDLETPFAADSDYFPNGIHVHRLLLEEIKPWIASIRIGPWYYCQGGSTKDEAISALFEYMHRMKLDFEKYLKRRAVYSSSTRSQAFRKLPFL